MPQDWGGGTWCGLVAMVLAGETARLLSWERKGHRSLTRAFISVPSASIVNTCLPPLSFPIHMFVLFVVDIDILVRLKMFNKNLLQTGFLSNSFSLCLLSIMKPASALSSKDCALKSFWQLFSCISFYINTKHFLSIFSSKKIYVSIYMSKNPLSFTLNINDFPFYVSMLVFLIEIISWSQVVRK